MKAWNNLIGKQFGNLTVIGQDYPYQVPSTGKLVPRWICKCTCGHVFTVINNKLSNGRIPKCPNCNPNGFKNLIGQPFGYLIVVERGEDYESKSGKESRWWCKCTYCGRPDLVLIKGTSLRTGHTKTCGCIRGKITEYKPKLNIIQGVTFLSDEEILALQQNPPQS